MFFSKKKVKCNICGKEIDAGEEIFLKLQYPYYDGTVRIKKFIENECKVICKKCFTKGTC
jgi:hypothetical protein